MASLNQLRPKLSVGLLLLVLSLVMGACGGSDSPGVTATVTPTESTASSSVGATSTAGQVPRTATPQPTATQTSSSGGSGTVDLDDALDEAIRLYEELFDTLAIVTDETSARAAADDIARIINQFEELDKRFDYSDAEIASATLSSRLFDISQEFSNEMVRLAANPAVFALLAEAFEDLENVGGN